MEGERGEQIRHNQSGHVAGAQVPARSPKRSRAPRVEPAAPRVEPAAPRGGAGAARLRERSRGSLGKRPCVQVKLINSPGGAAAPHPEEPAASQRTARHLGPTPRGRLKFGRMLACQARTARNRRVKDARRSVTGPLSAASARYLRMGDFLKDFLAVKARFINGDIEPLGAPEPVVLVNSPPRFTLRRRA